MFHFHDWKLVSLDATGYGQKANHPENKRDVCKGSVWECEKCKKLRLKPHDLRLNAVEVTKDE